MALIVQKYGGTSVANAERIRNVAARVVRYHSQGDQIVVVAIVPPRRIDAKTKELLKELERLDDGSPRGGLDW